MSSFYVTSPIYYVNDKPHLGHAYTSVACDVMSRFKRLDGFDTKFLTGTDEHGLKVKQAAEARGITPQQFTDEVSETFRTLTPLLNLKNDDFIRTTQERHKLAVQHLWRELVKRDEIYLGKYAGWYAVRDEAYYGEDELTTNAEGKKIAPTGAECAWVEEESYFFRLSKWGDKLLEFYEKNPDFVAPEGRFNEVKSFVKGGLKDLSVSRTTFDWGVPVPDAPGHVMYVWIDALTNYLSAIGYPENKGGEVTKYWPEAHHFVGKDILRFHAVYWPAFLMAADLAPPKRIYAHGWWTIEGQKMSKSIGNVIAPADLVERYGVDGARYFMMREVPFGQDGDFSNTQAIQRINADIANGLGNLAQRTLSFIAKNADAVVPQAGALTDTDKALLDAAYGLLEPVRAEFDRQRFNKALEAIFQVVYQANQYIDVEAPWTLKKTDQDRMRTVLYVLVEVLRCLGLILQPFVPGVCEKLLDQLSVAADQRTFAQLNKDNALPAGVSLPQPQGIFPRIEVKEEA